MASLLTGRDGFIAAPLFVSDMQMKQLLHKLKHLYSGFFFRLLSLHWISLCLGIRSSFFLLSGCISVSVVIDFLCKQPRIREKWSTWRGGKESICNLQHHPPTSRHFVSRENGSSQITGWCLQQSPSLSSPCFHDNDMTCLAPQKQGGETNPSFLTAPKCLLSHPQQFSHRQTQQSEGPATTKHRHLPPTPPPLLAVFSLQTPEQTLSFMKNMRYRTNLICVGRHMPHTHGGWFRRLFRSVLIFHPWKVGGVRVAVVSPSQWQQLPLQRGRRWTGGKSCPAAAQTNHSTYYTSLLENALRNIQLIFSKNQRECEQFHQ